MDILAGIGIFVCLVGGIIFFSGDFRHFGDIEKQCESQGYIQNSTTRIICHKETK